MSFSSMGLQMAQRNLHHRRVMGTLVGIPSTRKITLPSLITMRELTAPTHKARRSSFSNTLSELPEVDEPYPDTLSPVPALLGEAHAKLPPIIDVASLATEARPEVQHRPSLSKPTFQHGKTARRSSFSNETTFTKAPNSGIGPFHDRHPPAKRCQKNVTQPHVKSGSLHPHSERRWSIGSLAPPDTTDHVLPERRLSNDERMMKYSNHQEAALESTTHEKTSVNSSPHQTTPRQRKLSNAGLDLQEKERIEILQDPMLKRRWSKTTFAETTKKVNMLLKAGQNLNNKLNPTEGNADRNKTIRTLADLAFEMPKNPRFSAMMSPEAQYSMMMGYEDKIYDTLVSRCPEYKKLLRRNKTPVQKVKIRRKGSISFVNDDDNDDDDDDDEINYESEEDVSEQNCSNQSSFLTQPSENTATTSVHSYSGTGFLGSRYQEHRGSVQSLDSTASDYSERPDSRTTLRSLRRLSLSLEKKHYLDRFFDRVNQGDDELEGSYVNLHRSCSLPNVSALPFSRRLMMTHRLESAMDILDGMKSQEETSLSPRIKTRKSVPVADYSSWTHEWNKEFRVDPQHTSTITR